METTHIIYVVVCLMALVAGEICPRKCRSCINNVTDCSNMNLPNPPKDFSKYTTLVNLDGNQLKVLGRNAFQRLPEVEVLKARGNKLRLIKKDSFKNIPKLMTLDLSNNIIFRMYSKSFEGVKNLRTLSLASNKIATVTGILDNLPSLFQLNLAHNKIRVIHAKTFHKNTKLHLLDLRSNMLTRIHRDAFKNLKYLRYLFLNNNPLVNLPELNFGSSVLQLLDFSFCKIKNIPRGTPPSVTDLRLGNNQIEEIRKNDVTNVTNLRLLALNNNKIHKIPFMAFSNLKNLQELWLRENKLIYIPRGLPNNLRKLYMDSNQVVTIERVLFKNESRLEYMTVENNRVQVIKPGALSRLKYLRFLNLQGNTLTNITKGMFANIGNLSVLTLSNNPIKRIERGAFKNLGNLTALYMSYIPVNDDFELQDNFLPAMPNLKRLSLMGSQSLVKSLLQILEDTPVMQNLTELDLTYNDIMSLPDSIQSRFPNIQALSIEGNFLRCDNKLLWLAKWMNSSDVKFFTYEEPRCEQPYEIRGQLVTSMLDQGGEKVVPEDDDNPQNSSNADLKPLPKLPLLTRPKEDPEKVTKIASLLPVKKVAKATKGLTPAGMIGRALKKTARTTGLSQTTPEPKLEKRKKTEHRRRRQRRHRKYDGERKSRRKRKGNNRRRRHRRIAAKKSP